MDITLNRDLILNSDFFNKYYNRYIFKDPFPKEEYLDNLFAIASCYLTRITLYDGIDYVYPLDNKGESSETKEMIWGYVAIYIESVFEEFWRRKDFFNDYSDRHMFNHLFQQYCNCVELRIIWADLPEICLWIDEHTWRPTKGYLEKFQPLNADEIKISHVFRAMENAIDSAPKWQGCYVSGKDKLIYPRQDFSLDELKLTIKKII
jgi:hypothetical protein